MYEDNVDWEDQKYRMWGKKIKVVIVFQSCINEDYSKGRVKPFLKPC